MDLKLGPLIEATFFNLSGILPPEDALEKVDVGRQLLIEWCFSNWKHIQDQVVEHHYLIKHVLFSEHLPPISIAGVPPAILGFLAFSRTPKSSWRVPLIECMARSWGNPARMRPDAPCSMPFLCWLILWRIATEMWSKKLMEESPPESPIFNSSRRFYWCPQLWGRGMIHDLTFSISSIRLLHLHFHVLPEKKRMW